MTNPLEEIQKIYPDFKVSADGETGDVPLDKKARWTLKVVKSENPDNWKVLDAVTGEPFNMPSRGIPAAMRMIANEFICTYKDIAPKLKTEPIDNFKECGFEFEENAGIGYINPPVEYPIESFEEPENNDSEQKSYIKLSDQEIINILDYTLHSLRNETTTYRVKEGIKV